MFSSIFESLPDFPQKYFHSQSSPEAPLHHNISAKISDD